MSNIGSLEGHNGDVADVAGAKNGGKLGLKPSSVTTDSRGGGEGGSASDAKDGNDEGGAVTSSPTSFRPNWSKNGGTFKPPETTNQGVEGGGKKKSNAYDMLNDSEDEKDAHLGGAGTTVGKPQRSGRGGGRSLADLAAKSPQSSSRKGRGEAVPSEMLDGNAASSSAGWSRAGPSRSIKKDGLRGDRRRHYSEDGERGDSRLQRKPNREHDE